MGSTAQLYNLGWPDFGQTLKQTVGGLRSHGDLFDVTLAAEGKTFPAHKLVLSASSPLLLDLLKVTPCKHPVILLPGVTATDMEFLLEFIYTGEVNVHSDRLPSLFQAARLLDIHGLSQGKVSPEIPTPKQDETLTTDSLRLEDKDNGPHTIKRPKRKCRGDVSPTNEKWPRWDTSTNEQTIETEAEGRPSTSTDPNYQMSTKQGTEAAVTLATLHNVVPGPSWNKMPHNSRSRTIMTEDGDHLTEVPPHHLHDLSAESEEHGHDESYSAIAAAADAAAVAAATLSDKKGSSEQPVACPFCNFIIKQSRNLRRHLEIKHFGGARPKKMKGKTKAAQTGDGINDTDTESSTDPTVIDHVQVEIKSPAVDDNSSMVNATTGPKDAHPHTYTQQPQLQQYAHVGPALLSHQMVAPTTGGYVPQHIQILKSPHGGAHPLLAATVTEQGTHFLGLYATDNIRPPSHQ